MAAREETVSATLVELADTLVSDYDLPDFLDRLLGHAVHVLDGDAGGVMLAPGPDEAPGELEVLASSDERTRVLEVFELQRQEGPCIDSYRGGRQVVDEDLPSSGRWPRFTPMAVELGYQSVYAFPLRLRGRVIGALNLFRERQGAVTPENVVVAQTYADMATIGILQQRAVQEARGLAASLQTALNSRVVIEQAKGVLAERAGYDMPDAFQVMRRYAREHDRGLREVAADVVVGRLDGTHFPAVEPRTT